MFYAGPMFELLYEIKQAEVDQNLRKVLINLK